MCGIAGILLDEPSERALLLARAAKMGRAQRFRGPDGEGAWADDRVALAYVRLAIVGEDGAQPFADPLGGHTVFNGEIYDHRDLARRMGEEPPPDVCDGWILARLLARRGAEGLLDARGMFAAARYDPGRGTLLLVRDAVGKKPLYVRRFPGGWAFASTLSGIAAGSGPLQIRRGAVEEYLVYRSVGGLQSAFDGIEQVPPGGWVELRPGGLARSGHWWRPPDRCDSALGPVAVRSLIDAAVAQRAAPEREVAVLVSGGLDSAIVAASLRRQRPDQPMVAWTIGYDVRGPEDETSLATELATRLDIPVQRVQLSAPAVPSLLVEVARLTEDPIQDPVTLPTLVLARAISARTKVALTGDGSDEVWAGYARFTEPPATLDRYLPRTVVFRPDEIGLSGAPPSYLEAIELPPPDLAPLDRILRLEVANRLRNYHLARVDKLTMAAGIEARCPFLDREVVTAGLRIPAERKRPNGKPKGLLAAAFAGDLPERLLSRPKQPFTVPIAAWLAGPLRDFAVDTLTSEARFTRAIDARPWIDGLASSDTSPASAASKIWSLLQLEAWHVAARPLLGGLDGAG